MKRIIATIAVLLATVSLSYAETSSSASTGRNIDKSSGVEKTKSRKESQSESDESGGGRDKSRQTGTKTGTSKSKARAKETGTSSSLTRNLNVVPLYVHELAKTDMAFKTHINDVLLTKINPYPGVVNNTALEYLSAAAKTTQSIDGLADKQMVLSIMRRLAQTGDWMRDQLDKIKLTAGWSYNDWKDLARLSVEADLENISQRPIDYDITDRCVFWNDYKNIKCGDCVLNLSLDNTIPELACGGMKIFTVDAAGGLQMSASIVASSSDKESVSESESSEWFRGFTETANEYVRWGVKNDKAVEAATVKKAATNLALSNSSKADVVAKAMASNDDPSKIMAIIGK